MQLNDQQQEFYATMEQTFGTKGWILLRQGWEEEQASLSDVVFYNAKSMDDVNTARVRHGLLNELVQLPETIAAQKDAILNDEGDEPVE